MAEKQIAFSKPAEQPPAVAPRADFKPAPVFIKASIADQAGHKPGYVRHWFHKDDAQDPRYYAKYNRTHYVGDQEVGFCQAAPWSIVPRDEAKPGRPRDDEGKGIETALTHGDLICLETPEENYAIYREYDRLRDLAQAKKLGNDKAVLARGADGAPTAAYRAAVATQSGGYGDQTQLLNQGS